MTTETSRLGTRDKYFGTLVAIYPKHEYIVTFERGCWCFWKHLPEPAPAPVERPKPILVVNHQVADYDAEVLPANPDTQPRIKYTGNLTEVIAQLKARFPNGYQSKRQTK